MAAWGIHAVDLRHTQAVQKKLIEEFRSAEEAWDMCNESIVADTYGHSRPPHIIEAPAVSLETPILT